MRSPRACTRRRDRCTSTEPGPQSVGGVLDRVTGVLGGVVHRLAGLFGRPFVRRPPARRRAGSGPRPRRDVPSTKPSSPPRKRRGPPGGVGPQFVRALHGINACGARKVPDFRAGSAFLGSAPADGGEAKATDCCNAKDLLLEAFECPRLPHKWPCMPAVRRNAMVSRPHMALSEPDSDPPPCPRASRASKAGARPIRAS